MLITQDLIEAVRHFAQYSEAQVKADFIGHAHSALSQKSNQLSITNLLSEDDKKHIGTLINHFKTVLIDSAKNEEVEVVAKIFEELARHQIWHAEIRGCNAIQFIAMRLEKENDNKTAEHLINALSLLANSSENHDRVIHCQAIPALTCAASLGLAKGTANPSATLLNLAQRAENKQKICDKNGVNILTQAATSLIERESFDDARNLIDALQALNAEFSQLEDALNEAKRTKTKQQGLWK